MECPENLVKVCKTFFLHTLSISDKAVCTVHNKLSCLGISSEDSRGKHRTRPNRMTEEQKQKVKQHIESFKTVESHYCRKHSSKQYLPAGLSVAKMHMLYKNECEKTENCAVSLKSYRQIFDYEYNLAFHKPLKDQCDLCVAYQNASETEKTSKQKDYERHIKNKTLSRTNKEEDKNKAKVESDFCAACFDLEQVLLTPHSFESSLYYKRRLSTYNFTIYDMGTTEGYCFVWGL